MSTWMDVLREPALGMVFAIFLLAVIITVTAFATLIAQMSLWLRMKSFPAAERSSNGPSASRFSPASARPASQLMIPEPAPIEIVDADGWREV